MPRGSCNVVAIARIIAAERAVGALLDSLGAVDDSVERRAQHLVEGIVECGSGRGRLRTWPNFGLNRAPKSSETAVGASHDLAIEDYRLRVIGAAAGALAGK